MALRDSTRRLFADTIQKMMEKESLDRIRVKDLCRLCGADRQTFYYHFRDKYDLIAWIYAGDYSRALESTEGACSLDHAAAILEEMWRKRTFYRKAFTDKSQNAVSRYIYSYYVELGTEAVRSRLGPEALTAEALYDIRSHAFACLGHTIEWLEGKNSYSPAELARLQYRSMPPVLKDGYGIPREAGLRPEETEERRQK